MNETLPSETAPQQETERSEIVRFEEISKRFGRLIALENVSLSIYENEILAVVGDNGAGKSTLMNILSGVHEPTSGRLYLRDQEVQFSNPSDARANGIETVYQDLALMDDLDIATNIFIGGFPKRFEVGPISLIDWAETHEQADEILEFLNQDMNTSGEVEFLSGGQRQLVAIARALTFEPDLFIFDEPTSALSVPGTELVYDTMRDLKKEGHTQLIVSHNIRDTMNIADRIAVMYQGTIVDIIDPDEAKREEIEQLLASPV